jgi:hypothetical protein
VRAIVRLILSYFTCTWIARTCSTVGFMMLIVSYLALEFRFLPQLKLIPAIALIGGGMLYIGSTLMPLMFGQTARSHLIHLLPNGRLKLLASAFVTVAVVSLPLSALWASIYQLSALGDQPDPAYAAQVHETRDRLFWAIYTSAFLISSWLYVALWFITSQRTAAGLLRGMLVLILLLYAPTQPVKSLHGLIELNVICGGTLWLVFACGFLSWPSSISILALTIPGNLPQSKQLA